MSLLDYLGPQLGRDPYTDAEHLRSDRENLLEVRRLAAGNPLREALLDSILNNPEGFPHPDEEVGILLDRFRREMNNAAA